MKKSNEYDIQTNRLIKKFKIKELNNMDCSYEAIEILNRIISPDEIIKIDESLKISEKYIKSIVKNKIMLPLDEARLYLELEYQAIHTLENDDTFEGLSFEDMISLIVLCSKKFNDIVGKVEDIEKIDTEDYLNDAIDMMDHISNNSKKQWQVLRRKVFLEIRNRITKEKYLNLTPLNNVLSVGEI